MTMHTTQHYHVNETLHVSQQVYLYNHTHIQTQKDRNVAARIKTPRPLFLAGVFSLSLSRPFSLLGSMSRTRPRPL